MKKKTLTLMLAGTLIVSSLTGCGKGDDVKDDNKVNEQTTDTTEQTDEQTANLDDAITDKDISMEDLIASVKLCDYSKISLKTTLKEVTEEDVKNEMETYISYFTSYEHINEGKIKDKDKVNITYKGLIDGEEFDGGSGTYDLEIGSNSFIDGFEEGLIGVNVGDTKTLNLKFPEDYTDTSVAGKDVVFEVTVNYILGEAIEPELTDEFLASNTDYKTVKELEDAIKEYFETQNNQEFETAKENEILDYLIENSELPKIPISYVNSYIDDMTNYYKSYAEMYEKDFSEFCNSYMGVTEEEFNTQTKKSAILYVQSSIVLQALVKEENIELSDEEFDKYVEDFASNNGYESADDLKNILKENDEESDMRQEALFMKTLNYIYDNYVEK